MSTNTLPANTATLASDAGDDIIPPGAKAESVLVGRDARRWVSLAVGSLLLAGLLSLAVVIGRLPPFNSWIGDPLFFKRCLVVHVDLALLVWFYTFLAAMVACAGREGSTPAGKLCGIGAAGGVLLMLSGATASGAEPVLANYVPVIDHPVFLSGLGLFFASTTVFLLARLFQPRPTDGTLVPEESVAGLQAASVAVILALTTWIGAKAGLPAGLDRHTYFELTLWGPGHALQVANICAMAAVWLWLARRATDVPVLSLRGARLLFTVLLAPHLFLPLLSAFGTNHAMYVNGATELMRWGIFPVVLVLLGLTLRHLFRHRIGSRTEASKRTALAGFISSAGLTLLGFILGAMIRDSSTLIPAHYHASLGGVTAAFMAAAYLIAGASSGEPAFHRWRGARCQLLLYGAGQAVFALGFAIGGFYGLGRKAYAGEQVVRETGEIVGLTVMGFGGLLATIAGVWFLILILGAVRHWWWFSPQFTNTTKSYE